MGSIPTPIQTSVESSKHDNSKWWFVLRVPVRIPIYDGFISSSVGATTKHQTQPNLQKANTRDRSNHRTRGSVIDSLGLVGQIIRQNPAKQPPKSK